MKKDNRISITTVTHMFTGILCFDINAKIPGIVKIPWYQSKDTDKWNRVRDSEHSLGILYFDINVKIPVLQHVCNSN